MLTREFLSNLLSEHLWKLLQLLSEKECIYPIQMVWMGAGEVSQKLAPVSSTIHHPLLVFVCLSSSFPSVSVQLYTLFSRRDWWRKRLRYHRKKFFHVGSHLWAMELANAREKKELVELSGSYSIFLFRLSSTFIFIKGYRVNKIPDLAHHKTVTAAERRLIEFITRFVVYWARTIKIKIYNILENKSNVGI